MITIMMMTMTMMKAILEANKNKTFHALKEQLSRGEYEPHLHTMTHRPHSSHTSYRMHYLHISLKQTTRGEKPIKHPHNAV